MTSKTVLIADDDSAIRTVLIQAFTRAGFSVRSTATAAALWRWVGEGVGDIIVTDVILPDENVFNLIPHIKKARPRLPIIVMSAQNTIMTAIKATELGAYDYLPKPFDLHALIQTANRAIEQNSKPLAQKPIAATENLPIIGRSGPMQEIYRVIARLTQTDLTVLISGESGTGKELVARALHDFSKRKRGAFVAVNMAAIPRDLIESELFGHEKGAFTGAVGRMAGRFEQAEGGTLFLDEIGDMPLEAQTRLLRVLQQGEYNAVGGSTAIKTNVRIVAATHRDLRQLVEQGLFREDLFFRLNVVPLRLPPLRERSSDIPDLVRHFLAKAVADGLPAKDISLEGIEALKTHSWPGNVRELENLIKRLMAIEVEEVIGAASVIAELTRQISDHVGSSSVRKSETLTEDVEAHMATLFASGEVPTELYEYILEQIEPPLLRATLAATRGNQIKAAEILGINRNTLRAKINKYDIRSVKGFT